MSVIQLLSAVPRRAPACVRVCVCARASLLWFDNIRLLGVNLCWSKRLTVCAYACRAQIKVELSGARTACCLLLLLLHFLLLRLPLNHRAPSIGRHRGSRSGEARKRRSANFPMSNLLKPLCLLTLLYIRMWWLPNCLQEPEPRRLQ